MRLILAALALAALSACHQKVEESSDVAAFEPGPPACGPVMFEDSPLTECVAEPGRDRIRMVLSGKDDVPFRSFKAFADSRPGDAAPVAFAMNAGMFDEEGQPIGYFVADGKRSKVLNERKGPGNFHMLPNGVFFGTGDNWQVLDTERFADEVSQRPEFATQSGPMLVIGGELHPAFDPDGASLKIRNGVGVDEAGRAHFLISEAPISFGKFARYFRDVAKTPNALFLDGSVSSLWDPGHERMDSRVPLGPLVVVERIPQRAQE
ncbi:phosphodiester glycosidase family protein [Croceibacterium aestuarii]|uniref:phosphodiester glycosidase family protein n=1 Tax=Croceibacterium aestuarii TaxID=3064139 RepID=UPI00272DF006|nr:phosphodiester glycosidase family protein [Croceibacterium sp. D39]